MFAEHKVASSNINCEIIGFKIEIIIEPTPVCFWLVAFSYEMNME